MKQKEEIIDKLILNKDSKTWIDPIYMVIDNQSEIEEISNKSYNYSEFLNFNKSNINLILYNSEDFIIIKYRLFDNFPFYFYLASLIEEKSYLTNFFYNLDLIKKIISIFKITIFIK